MKRYIIYLATCLCMAACSGKKDPIADRTEQTVFMYLPWSSDLTPYFYNNIADFKAAIGKGILSAERVIVFLSTSATEATLFELVYQGRDCVEKPLKSYTNPPITTAAGITAILNDVQHYSPADRYGMIIGCHGMGWLPANGTYKTRSAGGKFHWEHEGAPLTRFFGGQTANYRTDITTLASGISGAGLKMEYILFDDCYLSTVEVAYDLKEAASYLIACPTEIMAHGMPYEDIAQYLVGNVDYKGITDGFYDFYKNYSTPCGTIGVTKCSELDNLAAIMKEINTRFPTFDTSLAGSLQRMDGYSPVIFFDFGDYVSKLCTDPALLARFEAQLERTVPPAYKRHTNNFYSASWFYSTGKGEIKINAYSGITISDPSQHSWTTAKTGTAWHKATH